MTSTRKRCDLYSVRFYANVILLHYFASAYTDPLNVKALEDFYGFLNQPTMLTGMATGGDPCGQNWTGASYSGSSMIFIKISGLGHGGTMSSQLSSFHSLSQLEIWEVEQYLVQYGSPYLHDLESLQRTADPTISREVLTSASPIGSLFPDGQVLAVKRLAVVQMESLEGKEEFLDLVLTLSDLKHCNICILQGYYARNGSLYSALFSNSGDYQKPLLWKLRLRIALGVACALEYMHEICSPLIANGNIKARNVLFDEEFVPHVTGFGLTMLSHILPATSVDFKMFENLKGYSALEMSIPGSDTIEGDIFSFGVLLLKDIFR